MNRYPYTDMHEMNLDWILLKVKEMIAQWDTTKNAWTELKEFVETYFENLDVQQEINNKLDEMAAGGELAELMAPYVTEQLPSVVGDQIADVVALQISAVVAAQLPDVVTDQLPAIAATAAAAEVGDWLTAHVDPDTGYVIDDSLTIQLAAADAKMTGDRLGKLYSAADYSMNKQGYVDTDGTFVSNSGYRTSSLIRCEKGGIITGDFNNAVWYVSAYDEDEDFIAGINVGYGSVSGLPFTVPSGTVYVRITTAYADRNSTSLLIPSTEDEDAYDERQLIFNYKGYVDASGVVQSNSNYRMTPYIEVNCDTAYVTGRFVNGVRGYVVCYDSGYNYIDHSMRDTGSLKDYFLRFQPGTKYVRIYCYAGDQSGIVFRTKNNDMIRNYYVDADGTGDYANLRLCFEAIDQTKENYVYLKPGTYYVNDWYSTAEWEDSDFKGLYVPNNTTVIGMGDKNAVIITADNGNSAISTLNFGYSAALKNLTVSADGMRYAIHDDGAHNDGHLDYYRLIEDCVITGVNLINQYVYGAGLKDKAHFTFRNVTFSTSDASNSPFYLHNNTGWKDGSEITFENCRFKGSHDHSMILATINASGYDMNTNVTMKGNKLDHRLFMYEQTGDGVLYYVSGYANEVPGVIIDAAYADRIDLI